ncbi:hypothetical protein OO185_02420 [Prosthecochloris sp. SCSIO W1102]|uniref:hypothetical protein n=1 Tax=Prosthecochloris sp. SCSIO W1102 TaxID=2992243 RepID=UPI00223D6E75|nr:hypothetical protein [Prosthecochloris sp. SCSIO W1102]UZJ39975.1 hypothetical protein OO185_02420 [Prosthecochloris sp. SCSIO W1102]
MQELVIPGELYSSKNSRRPVLCKSKSTGKTKIVPLKSKKAEEHFQYLLFVLSDAKRKVCWKRMIDGKRYPLVVTFKIYRKSNRVFDYVNIIQNLCDALVKSGYLPDDDAAHLLPIPLQYEKDALNPRTILTVL